MASGGAYFAPIDPIRVQKPNYDISGAFDTFSKVRGLFDQQRERDTARQIGAMLAGGDLRGGASTAFNAGDLKTGLQLRQLQSQEVAQAEARQRQREADARARTTEAEARTEKARKYVSNMMSSLNPNDANFASDWGMHLNRLRNAGYKIGKEYDDPRTGYQAALAEISDFKSRATIENQRRDDGLREQEIRIRQGEADSRALQRNRRDVLDAIKVMQTAATPEQWQQAQPIIQATFGRSVPYNERNVVLAQAQSTASAGDEFEPTERDRALGVTREQKIRDAQNEELKKLHGLPKRGYVWSTDAQGNVTQKLVATPVKPVDPGMKDAVRALVSRLDKAQDVLTEPGFLGSGYIRNAAGEYLGIGDAGRALEDYEQAALGAVYAMSGKQTTNKEMERFLRINKPQPGDSTKTIKIRTDRIRRVLSAIYSGMGRGLDYEDAEARAFAMPQETGDQGPARVGKRGDDLRSLSDQELLEMLGRPDEGDRKSRDGWSIRRID